MDYKRKILAIPSAEYPYAAGTTVERNQAETIVAKFGGPYRLAQVLHRIGFKTDPSVIFKWTYPRERRGTGGNIPTRQWPKILLAAQAEGIVLESEDFDPRPTLIQIKHPPRPTNESQARQILQERAWRESQAGRLAAEKEHAGLPLPELPAADDRGPYREAKERVEDFL